MSHPAGLPDLFIDRSLGRIQVPGLLRAAGLRLVTLAEHYGIPADETVADTAWLAEVGQRGWVALMKDENIRRNRAERLAVKQHAVAGVPKGTPCAATCTPRGKVGELPSDPGVLGWSSTSSATAGGCHSTRAAQKAVSTAQALTGLWSRCSYPRPSGLRTLTCRSGRCPACRWRCRTGAWPHHSGRCRTAGSPRASPRPGWREAG